MLDPIDHAVEVLNRIHEADHTVLPALISYRVPCNEAVADDPTVQVGSIKEDKGRWEVGFLGVINGLFGIDEMGRGYVMAMLDEDGTITHFVRRNYEG